MSVAEQAREHTLPQFLCCRGAQKRILPCLLGTANGPGGGQQRITGPQKPGGSLIVPLCIRETGKLMQRGRDVFFVGRHLPQQAQALFQIGAGRKKLSLSNFEAGEIVQASRDSQTVVQFALYRQPLPV